MEGAAAVKKLIATIAFVLWLIPLVSAQAQQTYRDEAIRRSGKTFRPGSSNQGAALGQSRGTSGRTRPSPPKRSVRVASHAQAELVQSEMVPTEPIPQNTYVEGEYIDDGGYVVEGDYFDGQSIGCDSCGGGGCDSCGISHNFCDGCHAPRRFCICFPNHGWVQAEYLLWDQSGMDLPPLVTTSPDGTARAQRGYCPEPLSCTAMAKP